MIEWIISSSVLIVVVILLRFALRGKISLRLQYALWALVLARLLVPVSLADSAVSIENLTQKVASTEPVRIVLDFSETALPKMSYDKAYYEVVKEYAEKGILLDELTPEQFADIDDEIMNKMAGDLSVAEMVRIIWVCGVALIGLWLVISNLYLASRLRKTREPLTMEGCKLPVYISDAVDTPCLFGLLRPVIYVTREAAADEMTLRHAVEHELTHYHHRDNIWAILRGVCLTIHWYNPLVWWAAVLSRNDAELACDETTIRRLGEEERAAYGRTLIGLTCQKHTALLVTATTMTGSKKSIKERISFVVKTPKMALYTLIAVVLVAAIAAGCTFTGAKEGLTDRELMEMAYGDATATALMKGITMSKTGELKREGNEVWILFPVTAPEEKSGDYMKVTYRMEDEEGTATREPYSAIIEYVESGEGEGTTQDRYGMISVKGLENTPPVVTDYAVEYVQSVINDLNAFWGNSLQSTPAHSIAEANITKIEQIVTGTVGLNNGINMYRLEYRLVPNHPENVLLPDGMTMEEGRITEKGRFGQPYLLMRYEYDGDSTIWKRICVTSTYAIENVYGTAEMLDRYGNAYTAATMELYGEYLTQQQELENGQHPFPPVDYTQQSVTFPAYQTEKNKFNENIFDIEPFSIQFVLPKDWTIGTYNREEVSFLYSGTWSRIGLYDETGNCLGAIGYNIYELYEGAENEPMAIYNQIALGNNYHFDVKNTYNIVKETETAKTATVDVCYAPAFGGSQDTNASPGTNYGILSHCSEKLVYVAFEFENAHVTEEQILQIATSIEFVN